MVMGLQIFGFGLVKIHAFFQQSFTYRKYSLMLYNSSFEYIFQCLLCFYAEIRCPLHNTCRRKLFKFEWTIRLLQIREERRG